MNTDAMNNSIGHVPSRTVPKKTGTRITLVISSLGAGGAERVMSTMANYWAEHGHDVTLITLVSVHEDFYVLDHRVHRIGLGFRVISAPHFAAGLRNNFRRVRRLRQEIRGSRPDVVLSFINRMNVLTLAASLGLRIPVIAAEHTEPREYPIGSRWLWLQYLLYPRAAAVVVLTHSARNWHERFVRSNVIHVIPNPVSISAMKHNGASVQKGPGGRIAAMGRLSEEKRFDLLLQAFARCARKYPDWSLTILGEGDERNRLETLTRELGIKDQVSLPGRVHDPATVLRKADLFVLASRFEAFPMALLEAMACGLAVISTNCSGPREIIRDGVNGLLVPSDDVEGLATAMERLMADQAARERLGAHAVEVLERFSTEKIMGTWDLLFTRTSRCRTHE